MRQEETNVPMPLPAHVVIFPFPMQGHLNSMLNLAHLLSLSGLHVTFVVSEFSHSRLLTLPSIPGFHFLPISDGVPHDHPRAGLKILEIESAVNHTMVPLFKKMIQDGFLASPGTRRPVTCIIADGNFGFTPDFTAETGIPSVYFRTPSAAYFWAFFRLPELIEAGELPFRASDMDELVKTGLPGMEGFLRRRDLPSFFRADDVNDPTLRSRETSTKQATRAQAVIFNTCEELEEPIISEIRKYMPRTFTIGPIHSHLKSRLRENGIQGTILSGGFWAEDRSCIDWLNLQKPKSVVYVSFGSITIVTRQQLLEIWHGLVNSEQLFLWVMRPDSVVEESGENQLPCELAQGTKERGYFVDWAPQEEVLNHPAVGGFFTHSGWNSTLESIETGVPMICWPYFGDQTVNSRLVNEVWKIGLDIKDTCDRLIVENAIREIMEIKKDEFQKRTSIVAELIKKTVNKGGSSYSNLDNFIDYINSLII